jgi:hypothetical protein
LQKFNVTDRHGCGSGYVKSGIVTKEIKNPLLTANNEIKFMPETYRDS